GNGQDQRTPTKGHRGPPRVQRIRPPERDNCSAEGAVGDCRTLAFFVCDSARCQPVGGARGFYGNLGSAPAIPTRHWCSQRERNEPCCGERVALRGMTPFAAVSVGVDRLSPGWRFAS